MKKITIFLVLSFMVFVYNGWGQSSPGDIAFIAFNADGGDDIAFVTLVDIPASTSIYFTDNEWNGTAFNDLNEGVITWANGASTLSAGSVVVFTDPRSGGSVNVGSFSESGWDLNASDEWIYALLEVPATSYGTPPVFLTAFASDAGSGWLTGTGLTQGMDAMDFNNDHDGFKYTGIKEGQTNFADYLPLIMNISNWQDETSDGELILPISTTAFTIEGTSPNDNTSIADYAGITQPAPGAISSTAVAEGEAVNIFNFNITDTYPGTSDGLPTKVTRIVIKPGASNNCPWSSTIAGAKIATIAKVAIDASVTITDASITFDLITPLVVGDGTSEEILFSTWLVSDGSLIEDGVLSFGIDGENHGFEANNEGSQFAANFMIDSFFDVLIDVEGIGVEFGSIPNEIFVNNPFPVGVKVVDGNGNVDADAEGAVTLTTEVGTGFISSATGLTQTLSGGTYTWTDIIYPNPGDDELKIRATYTSMGWYVISDFIDCYEQVSLIINEVDTDQTGTDDAEFIELYDGGVGNTSLTGYVVVLFNGSGDISYRAYDLDGYLTDATGYFVIGSSIVPNVDYDFGSLTNQLQNEAEAVALYFGDDTDFPNGTAVSTTGLIDALVYDINDADDLGLLVLLNAGQPQINEDGRGNSPMHSNQRLPNGSGGQRNTNTYDQSLPTPGAANMRLLSAWTGAVDDDWDNAGNWSLMVPDVGLDALIPDVSGSKAMSPTISGSATCYSLFMAPGSILDIGPSGALTVLGAYTNNGNLTIKSDASGNGSLIENSGVNANVEHYVSEERWHYISQPIVQANTSQFLGLYFMYYLEPSEEWTFIADPNLALDIIMKGNAIWSDQTTTGNATVTFNGVLNTGPQSINLTNTAGTTNPTNDPSGFNLVGNPFASALDWDVNDGSGWTRTATHVALSIYYYNGVQYGSYVKGSDGIGTNGATNIIPPHQGFMVYCTNATGSLSVDNGARVHTSQGFYKGSNDIISSLKFSLNGNSMNDEFIINVNENASSNFDMKFDAFKFYGNDEAPQAYTLTSNNEKLSINSIPAIEGNEYIPIGVDVGVDGIYEIKLTDINSFDGYPILLEDLQEGKLINIKETEVYNFYATVDDDPNRFVLHFTPLSVGDNVVNSTDIYSVDKDVYVTVSEFTDGNIRIYNTMGQEVVTVPINNSINKISLNKTGNYIVKVISNDNVAIKKVFIK